LYPSGDTGWSFVVSFATCTAHSSEGRSLAQRVVGTVGHGGDIEMTRKLSRRHGSRLLFLSLLLFVLAFGTAAAQESGSVTYFDDDFRDGFSAQGPDAEYFYFAAGPYVGNDGIESTSSKGLRVISSGTNRRTGKPAFIRTLGQEDDGVGNPFGLPGGIDHVKWLVYANHQTPGGISGFEAAPGQELSGQARISGRTFGTQAHPFGRAVKNPNDDLRLASVAFNSIDFESWMVFDFFITNERIYAFYERLPFGRTPDHNYAAFSYQIPLQERGDPGDTHDLRIAYDRSAGVVRWLVDGKEKFRVDRIGHRIDRKFMTLDHGGVEETVEPRQLDFGMGMFTILDGDLPSGKALVRLSNAPNFYFDPPQGEPTPQTFFDEESRASSRLFGQGAELRVGRLSVESAPASN
jgi:hypothetical protein